jgi:hypothetical protein
LGRTRVPGRIWTNFWQDRAKKQPWQAVYEVYSPNPTPLGCLWTFLARHTHLFPDPLAPSAPGCLASRARAAPEDLLPPVWFENPFLLGLIQDKVLPGAQDAGYATLNAEAKRFMNQSRTALRIFNGAYAGMFFFSGDGFVCPPEWPPYLRQVWEESHIPQPPSPLATVSFLAQSAEILPVPYLDAHDPTIARRVGLLLMWLWGFPLTRPAGLANAYSPPMIQQLVADGLRACMRAPGFFLWASGVDLARAFTLAREGANIYGRHDRTQAATWKQSGVATLTNEQIAEAAEAAEVGLRMEGITQGTRLALMKSVQYALLRGNARLRTHTAMPASGALGWPDWRSALRDPLSGAASLARRLESQEADGHPTPRGLRPPRRSPSRAAEKIAGMYIDLTPVPNPAETDARIELVRRASKKPWPHTSERAKYLCLGHYRGFDGEIRPDPDEP